MTPPPISFRPIREGRNPVPMFLTWVLATIVAWGMLVLAMLMVWMSIPASAHEAPLGWLYGIECCSNMDCRQLASGDVGEKPEGYLIRLTGEVIPYNDRRIKLSRDEFYHQCTPGGKADAKRSICLYVPNRGF